MPLSRYITVADAARRLGLSTQRIYQLIKTGCIEAVQAGEGDRRVWLIDRDALPTLRVRGKRQLFP